jgi:hypothetical protein
VVIIVLTVNVVNTKVIANLLIFVVLKFHANRPDGLGAMDVRVLLSSFTYDLNRSK